MKEKFCRDCPCKERPFKARCRLQPPRATGTSSDNFTIFEQPWVDDDDWCYLGRQIMEMMPDDISKDYCQCNTSDEVWRQKFIALMEEVEIYDKED